MKRKIAPGLVLCGLGIAGPIGCLGSHADPLDSRVFVVPQTRDAGSSPTVSASAVDASVDRTPPPPLAVEVPETATVLPDKPAPIPPPFDTIKPLDELGSAPSTQPSQLQVNEAIPAAHAGAAIPAAIKEGPSVSTTGPSESPADAPSAGLGVYKLVGGVVAQVNETPIFTNQLLEKLNHRFAIRARELSPRDFQMFAVQEILERLHVMIDDEREFGSAYHSLSEEDRNLTEAEAMMIRHDRVVAAGGSVAEARRISAAHGEDFDESIRQEYRKLVFQAYFHRQLSPLILVTPDGMRDYYNQNPGKFCQKAQVQFRVIQIDPDKRPSIAVAREQAARIREKAAKGADFAELATAENDDEFLKKRGGCPIGVGEWMDKGAFGIAAVDSAIWQLQPGQITPVVEARGMLFIAKLEVRRDAVTREFDDPTVQAEIYSTLYQQQYGSLMHQRTGENGAESMLAFDPSKRIPMALEIVMQDYARVQAEMLAGR